MLPDLTGVWRLIHEESDFAFLPPPELRTDNITHRDPQLQISTRQVDANGDLTVERRLEIGGETVEIEIHGRPRKIRARWEETTLALETRHEVSGRLRLIEDRFRLDADGAWLTLDRLHHQPGGAVRQRLRLQRL